jgi:hypothetical protein
MAKSISSLVLNAALSYIQANADRMTVCSGAPTTLAMALSTEKLASIIMSAGNFTVSAGSASGRRCVVSAVNSIVVSVTGSAQHVAILDTDGAYSAVLCVTTCTNQTLTAGNTVNVPTWAYEINDPT